VLLSEVVVRNIDIPATTRRIEPSGRSFLTTLNASNASSIFFLASNRLSETKVALSLSNVINISLQDCSSQDIQINAAHDRIICTFLSFLASAGSRPTYCSTLMQG
jgi:hypothetical protein